MSFADDYKDLVDMIVNGRIQIANICLYNPGRTISILEKAQKEMHELFLSLSEQEQKEPAAIAFYLTIAAEQLRTEATIEQGLKQDSHRVGEYLRKADVYQKVAEFAYLYDSDIKEIPCMNT